LKPIEEIIRKLSERVERLEKQDQQAEAVAVIQGQNTTLQEAKFNALYSIVHELAAHEGISEEQIVEHFRERVRFYQDQLLRIAEDINPNWAGQIDERDQGEMPESESYSPLFPQRIDSLLNFYRARRTFRLWSKTSHDQRKHRLSVSSDLHLASCRSRVRRFRSGNYSGRTTAKSTKRITGIVKLLF